MTDPIRVLRQLVAPTGRHRAKPVLADDADETAPEQPDTTPDTTTPEGD